MIRAVIADTWRQSRQQAVFIVMLLAMLLVLIAGIALPRTIVTADGEKHFGLAMSNTPDVILSRRWINEYARALGVEDDQVARRRITADKSLSPAERGQRLQKLNQDQQRLRNEAVAKASSTPEYRRSVEYYIRMVVSIMFTITMLLFIAACAGYFPAMLTSGAVDIVLSKPLSRLQIYASKYLGGIVLYAAAIAAFCVLLYIGIGIRTGIFHLRIFYGIPLLMFSAMVLYAILALIGTASRSATLALVLGYLLYVVVDSVIAMLLNLQPLFEVMGWTSVAGALDVVRHVLPNFGLMNDMALGSLLTMPRFQFTPFAVALAWLAGCFGLGYWIFQRRDY